TSDDAARAWAIARTCDPEVVATLLREKQGHDLLLGYARQDKSPLVRSSFVLALQRVPLDFRWELAEALLGRTEDVDNRTTSLTLWYGVEAFPTFDLDKSVGLLGKTKFPLVREFLARRITSLPTKNNGASRGIQSLLEL